eukprot:352374-Chlamydomonas_euryale.AAC.11
MIQAAPRKSETAPHVARTLEAGLGLPAPCQRGLLRRWWCGIVEGSAFHGSRSAAAEHLALLRSLRGCSLRRLLEPTGAVFRGSRQACFSLLCLLELTNVALRGSLQAAMCLVRVVC